MREGKITAGIAILCILCLACIAVLLDKISINQSSTLEQMLSPQDIARIDRYRTLFDVESEPVIIAIESPAPLPRARIQAIETSLLTVPAVLNTLSSVSIEKFGAGRQRTFSPKANTELIVLMISPESQQLAAAKSVSVAIRQTIDAQLLARESAFISGLPQIRTASWEISRADAKLILPLLVIITLIVTLLLFQSFTALALSLLLTSMTTCICLALQLMLKAEINALIMLVVPVIWAIATLDAFHLYSRTAIKTRHNHPHPARAAGKELFMPCLLTTATTAGCFLTLTLLDASGLIISFGVWGATGAIVAFILTFTLGTGLLSLQTVSSNTPRWPALFAFKVTKLAQRHSKVVVATWGALALCSIAAVADIKVATSFPQVFTEDTRIAAEINHLKTLTGSDLNAIDIIIESSGPHGESDESLAWAALLTNNYLNTIAETQLVLPLGVMDEDFLNQTYSKWQAERHSAENAETTAISGLENWVDTKEHAVRLQAYLAETTYRRKQEIISWLSHFDETMLSHHTLTLSGSGYFHYLTEKRGLASLLSSSLLALLIITATMAWLTRGTIPALVAVFASVIPGIILVGSMALFDIPWSIAMLPMPAVLLGLMNDDTIHILWSSKKSGRLGSRRLRANAIAAGPALLATTLVLSGAVGTLAFSGIQTNQYLGFLIPLGLLLALLCNLSLLPALSSLIHKSPQLKY